MSGANTWRGANTWSVALNENAQAGSGGGVGTITAGNPNITITGTATNPIISGTLVNLTSNVATQNFSLSGNTAGNPSFVVGGGQEFKVITTDLTPHILVSGAVGGGVQLGLPSGYGGYKVTAPTVAPSTTSDTQVATTAFVQSAIAPKVASVSAGNNIAITGTATAPIVGLQFPLTNTLEIGSQKIQSDVDMNLDIASGYALNVLNGNDINIQDGLASGYTASYRKDGLSESYLVGTDFATVQTTVGGAGASSFLGATNTAIPSNAYLRTEVFPSTDSLESHESPAGVKKNMAYQSQGNLTIRGGSASGTPNTVMCGLGAIGNNLTCNAGNTTIATNAGSCSINSTAGNTFNAGTTAGNANVNTIVSAGVGGATNPMLRVENQNASAGSVALETYKNGGAGVNGDEVFRLSMFGKSASNTKAEYGRITTFIRDSSTPTTGLDGAIIFNVPVNNTMTAFLDLNGNSNRVNCLRQFNIQSNDIISSGGDIHLNATASTGTGQVILAPKVGSYLIMNNLPTSSAGLPAGAVWRNGNVLNIV